MSCKPIQKPAQLPQDDVNLAIIGCVQLHPIKALSLPVLVLVAYREIPSIGVGLDPQQSGVNIHTSGEGAGVSGFYMTFVFRSERLQSPLPFAAQTRGGVDGLFRGHFACSLEFATARATAVEARPLNSVNPPQPDSPSSSAVESRTEISRVVPPVRSK